MSDNIIDETHAEPANEAPEPDELTDESEYNGAAETFPRGVVERLRRKSAGYRERAQAAEQQLAALQGAEERLAALQRKTVESQITAAGMRPAAVFAVAELDDLLAADGTVDTDKLVAAMASARDTLGIEQAPRRQRRTLDTLTSGASGQQSGMPGPSFSTAFGPRPRD